MNKIQWYEYINNQNRLLGDFGIKDPVTGRLNKMNEEKKKNTSPDFNLVVNVGTDEKAIWHRIGAGWEKEKGISIMINSLPMKSNIFLFKAEEKK